MKIIVQRVKKASVIIDSRVVGAIDKGLLLLIGFGHDDNESIVDQMVNKVLNLRIIDDKEGVMNLSVLETNGEILSVSQFTLYADTRKGRRPNYLNAAKQDKANALYKYCIQQLNLSGLKIATGVFQADMEVELINDGPVTIILDSNDHKSK